MADKKVEIRFETQADTKGAKDAEKALDQVKDAADDTSSAVNQVGAAADETGDELKLPEAKQGTKSLNQLTAELQRLEKELLDLPVGSKGFVDLAQKVKTAQKELEDAETVARKLGGTVGRKGNAGMAVLEFSRAFEDAQYGIRGVLNNIPGLIAQLGGGAGLAGIISIAAVAGTQLWERLGNKQKADDATKYVSTFKEALKTVKSALDSIDTTFFEAGNTDAVEAFQQRKNAINLETTALQASNTALQEKIQFESKLLEIQRKRERQQVDSQEAAGTISPAEATARRAAIDAQSIQDELESAKEMDAARLELEKVKRDQIAKEKEDAELAAEEAGQRLQNRQAQIAQLQKEGYIRAQLDAQLVYLREQLAKGAAESLAATQSRSAGSLEAGGGGSAISAQKLDDLLRKQQETADKIQAVEAEIAERAPTPIVGLETTDAEGNAKKIKSAYERAIQGLVEANEKDASPSLAQLQNHFSTLAQSAEDAGTRLQAAQQSLDLMAAQNQTRAEQRQTLAGAQQSLATDQSLQQAEQTAGKNISAELEKIITSIGDAASNPNVQSAVERARQLLSNGLQDGEGQQLTALANTIISQSKSNGEEQRKAFQSLQTTIQNQSDALSGILSRLRQLETTTNGLKAQSGQPNF